MEHRHLVREPLGIFGRALSNEAADENAVATFA
jgi:hypothetical protein